MGWGWGKAPFYSLSRSQTTGKCDQQSLRIPASDILCWKPARQKPWAEGKSVKMSVREEMKGEGQASTWESD